MATSKRRNSNHSLLRIARLVLGIVLGTASAAWAVDRTWTGAAGTAVINTANNWSGNAAPTAAGDLAIWDGTVQTNSIYVWNAAFGPTSGNVGAPSLRVGSGYTNTLVLMNSGAGGNLSFSNLVIDAGAGPFQLGSNGITSATVFRGPVNYLINNSTNVATIAQNVLFNNGGAVSRTLSIGGSGDWVVGSAIYGAGSGTISLRVDGTGANTVTLDGVVALNSTSHTISNGTMKLISGDALATAGTQTLTIAGGTGIRRLALSNEVSDVYLNPAVANLNIGGRDDVTGAANAAIFNLGGNNTINGVVRFNAPSGTNVGIYAASGTLTFNGDFTAANSTGDRYFCFSGPGTNYINGIIANGSAALGLRLSGGSLVLNNANTYTGNTVIDAGTLTLGNDLAVQNSAVVLNGGVLDLNGGLLTSPTFGGLSGAGVVDSLSGGTITLTLGNNNVSSSFAGTIINSSGTLSLQKVGAGTVALSGANTYSGPTTVANGTLLINNTTGSGTSSGNVTVNSGGTLGGTGTIQGNVNWQAGSSALFVVNPTTAVSGSNSTPLTVAGNITLNGNSVVINVPGSSPLEVGTYRLATYNNAGSSGNFAIVPTYTGAGAALATYSTVSNLAGTVTLTIITTGIGSTWTNNGSSDWSIGTNWSSNPYYPQVAGDSALLGVGSAYSTARLNTGVSLGTLVFTNANSFLVGDAGQTLAFDNSPYGAATIAVQAGTSNTVGTAIGLKSDVTVLASTGTSVALTNTISNDGGTRTVTLTGPGTLALSGNNTYGPASAGTVGTVVRAGGTLQVGHNNALGAGDLNIPTSSSIRAGAALTLANNIVADTGATATFDNNGNNVTLSGVVSGAGNFTKAGTGTLTLNAANTFTGNSTVNAGILKLGDAAGIPGGPGFGNVTVNTNGTLDLNATSPTINGLNGAGSVDSLVGGAAVLTVGGNDASGTFTGSLKNSAGSVTLVKSGAGTQTLAGTNTYSGGTIISAGTLQVGNGGVGGNLGTGVVTNDATLAFNQTVTNVVANAIHGIGQLNVANASMNLFLTGANTFSGNININNGHLWVNNPTALGSGPKTVFSVGGGVSLLTTLHVYGNITVDPSISYQLSYFGGALANESGTNTLQGDIGLPFGGGAAYINSKSGRLVLAGTISAINGGRTLLLGGSGDGLVSGTISGAGAGGALGAVQKTNSGTWTLSGASDTVTPLTVIQGRLVLDGQWAGAITVNSNAVFGGIGSANSTVTWQQGASAAFTLTESGGVNTTPFTVGGAVTLTNNIITVNIPGGVPVPAGTYTLMTYTAAGSSGTFASTPVITGAGVPTNTFVTVITANGLVSLMVANNYAWTNNGSGNWTTGANWSRNPNVPSNAGDFATLGVGGNNTAINLDASKTVSGLAFTNDNSFVITSAVNTLTLNNNGASAIINVPGGTSNSIATKVEAVDSAILTILDGKSLAISGNLGGAGGLTKTGNGSLSLSGSNSYSGVTTVSGGLLALGSTNAFGANTLTLSGGNLDSLVSGLVNQNNNVQEWVSDFSFLGSQSLNLGTGSVTMNGDRSVNVVSNTLTVGGSIISGGILTKSGEGTLVLQAANFMTSVTINAGTVAVGDDTSLGAGTLVFNSPTAGIRSADASPRTLFNSVNASFGGIYGGAGNLTFLGTIASGNFPKTFAVSNALTTFSGPLTDGGTPNGPNFKDGPGILLLEADNSTLTKAMTVNNGTLALGSATAIGTGALTINGGGLDSRVADLVLFGNNAQTWGGDFWFVGTENLDLGLGNVTLNTNVAVTVSNKVLTVGGSVSGNFGVTKAGAGRLVLNGAANNYGNTTVTGGTLEIATATLRTNSLVSVASGAVLQLNFSTTNRVAGLTLNGVAQPAGIYKSTTPGGYLAGPGALQVVPLGPTGPGYLTNTVTGNQLSLSWPPGQGWRLQAQTNSLNVGLSNNWSYLTDGSVSSTNITINPALPTVFYRLTYP